MSGNLDLKMWVVWGDDDTSEEVVVVVLGTHDSVELC